MSLDILYHAWFSITHFCPSSCFSLPRSVLTPLSTAVPHQREGREGQRNLCNTYLPSYSSKLIFAGPPNELELETPIPAFALSFLRCKPEVFVLKHESSKLRYSLYPECGSLSAKPVLHGPNSTEPNLFHHGETTYRV